MAEAPLPEWHDPDWLMLLVGLERRAAEVEGLFLTFGGASEAVPEAPPDLVLACLGAHELARKVSSILSPSRDAVPEREGPDDVIAGDLRR